MDSYEDCDLGSEDLFCDLVWSCDGRLQDGFSWEPELLSWSESNYIISISLVKKLGQLINHNFFNMVSE